MVPPWLRNHEFIESFHPTLSKHEPHLPNYPIHIRFRISSHIGLRCSQEQHANLPASAAALTKGQAKVSVFRCFFFSWWLLIWSDSLTFSTVSVTSCVHLWSSPSHGFHLQLFHCFHCLLHRFHPSTLFIELSMVFLGCSQGSHQHTSKYTCRV